MSVVKICGELLVRRRLPGLPGFPRCGDGCCPAAPGAAGRGPFGDVVDGRARS
ncbi:hypothetical protein NKG05_08570 [Oerskovia sp. M15]